MAAEIVVEPLTLIFNCSLSTGNIPKDFKSAKIIPIHKSGDKTQPMNYRPISILSIVTKILAKGIHKQLYEYLNEHSLLSENQSGFRPLHSTNSCILDINEYILQNMNSGYLTGGVFLDLRKAFDVIPHDKLLKKMFLYGIKGTEYKWFESYITNRTQCVSIDGTLSDSLVVKTGVAQGSTLGPLIFSMYLNDICEMNFMPLTKFSLYADDTVIFCKAKTQEELQTSLQSQFDMISDWMDRNEMYINIDKTKLIIFGSVKKVRNCEINITCNNLSLETVDKMKYLGVILDPCMKWTKHVNTVISKLSRVTACIRRIKPYLSRKNLIDLYHTMFIPHLDYCSIIWGNTTKCNIMRLQRAQNRYARMILNVDRYTSTTLLLRTLNWQSVQQRIKFNHCVMMFKLINNRVPNYLKKLISHRPICYSTRYAANSPLFVPTPRTEYMRSTFSYQGTMIFNRLPIHVQTCVSFESFKKQCKCLSFNF